MYSVKALQTINIISLSKSGSLCVPGYIKEQWLAGCQQNKKRNDRNIRNMNLCGTILVFTQTRITRSGNHLLCCQLQYFIYNLPLSWSLSFRNDDANVFTCKQPLSVWRWGQLWYPSEPTRKRGKIQHCWPCGGPKCFQVTQGKITFKKIYSSILDSINV